MTLSVLEAEQQLAAARANVQRLRREDAVRKIEELRREGAALRERLPSLEAQVAQAQAERLELHPQLLTARDQIAHYSAPLDPLTFPTDAEIAEHARQLALWQKRQQELLARHKHASQRETAQEELIAVKNNVAQMQQAIRNLSALAAGEI